MQAIGLDIGTTSLCGIRMDCRTGRVEQIVNRKNDGWVTGTNSWERLQDPQRLLEITVNILEELATKETAVIGLTGQMHGIVYLDRDGQAVSPLYTWQDGRGDQPREGGGTCASALGSHTGYGNVTHLYNLEHHLVPDSAVVFCTIQDYAAMKLAGRTMPLVHSSDGASFGNFDISAGGFTWRNSFQPQITAEAAVLGVWKGIPVAAAIGDNQASFLGGGCGRESVLVNVGTGSQVSFTAGTLEPGSPLEQRPLSGAETLLVGSPLCGGRAYALLEHFFRQAAVMAGGSPDSLYDAMAREAASVPETSLQFATLFCGTRAEPQRRASIENLSEENFTPGDLIRGCLNGIARELLELYQSGGGRCIRMVGTGNGVRRNPLLRRIIEDLFGMKMQIPLYPEEAAAGAALFAMTAAGIYKTLEEAEKIVQYEVEEQEKSKKKLSKYIELCYNSD